MELIDITYPDILIKKMNITGPYALGGMETCTFATVRLVNSGKEMVGVFPKTKEPPIFFFGHINTFKFFLESDACPKRKYPLFCLGGYPGDIIPEKGIYMNTEQLSRKSELDKILSAQLTNVEEIWDYSLANVNILKEYNIQAKHVPLISPKWYIEKLRLFRDPYIGKFEYYIGFCGAHTKRRTGIFQKLKDAGISLHIVKSLFYKKDEELAKCAILINIHCDEDYKIFESERCEPWLQLGVTVISEHSLDNDPRCINVDYDDLVNTVKYYLKK
jgi:hypothetical protein